jgi:hypothetical protein
LILGFLNWILGRRKRHELPLDRQDLKIRLFPKAFAPDEEETDLIWYGWYLKNPAGSDCRTMRLSCKNVV